jgi:hypothetical protein
MLIIPALRRLRQEDHKFEASVDYIARPDLQKKKTKTKIEKRSKICVSMV